MKAPNGIECIDGGKAIDRACARCFKQKTCDIECRDCVLNWLDWTLDRKYAFNKWERGELNG